MVTYESLALGLPLPLPMTPPTKWRMGWCELWDHTSKSTLLVAHMLDYCMLLGFHFTPSLRFHFTPYSKTLLRYSLPLLLLDSASSPNSLMLCFVFV